jgi:hypothetical protein
MTPELRVVIKGFLGKYFAKEPSTGKFFREGERLTYYENDGAHVIFVLEKDTNKTQPFTAPADDFEASTELGPSPR